MVHVARDRIVLTWQPGGVPRGVITGQLREVAGVSFFEVDWIIRFPLAAPRDALRMVRDLRAYIVAEWGVRTIVIKIRDDYQAEPLAAMAQAFGFRPYARQHDVTT